MTATTAIACTYCFADAGQACYSQESGQPTAPHAERVAVKVAKFERILDLENELRVSKALGGMIVGDSTKVIANDQARLFTAIEALNPAEMKAFGEYRRTQR